MYGKADDFLVHQTPDFLSVPASSDRDHYDRHFFNGYARDGEWFFAFGGPAVYPNRGVMDASFSLVHDGTQTNLRMSRKAPRDPVDVRIGPLSLDVLVPKERLRLVVAENGSGLSCDLTFVARGPIIDQGRLFQRFGNWTAVNMCHVVQHGSYEGWIELNGVRLECTPDTVWGTRDRSWGTRRHDNDGIEKTKVLSGDNRAGSQSVYLWAPINFADRVFLLAALEDGAGERSYEAGAWLPASPAAPPLLAANIGHRLEIRESSHHASGGTVWVEGDEGVTTVELEPILDFSMSGIGYKHPEWGHGRWQGEEAVAWDSFVSKEVDRKSFLHSHVETLCRARANGREGIGVLEQRWRGWDNH
jgi:hypothetical protein